MRWLTPVSVVLVAFSASVVAVGAVPDVVNTGVSEDGNGIGDGKVVVAVVALQGSMPPGAPTDVFAVAADAQVTLSWTAPIDDGGSPITSYLVTWYSDLVSVTRAVNGSVATSSSLSSYTMTGLTNGVTYTFAISAVSAFANGPASESVSVMPLKAPSTPVGLNGSISGGVVTLVWQEPLNIGGAAIAGYRVEQRLGGSGLWVTVVDNTGSASTRYTVDELIEGTSYDFQVAAFNAAGMGPMSNSWSGLVPTSITPAATTVTTPTTTTLVTTTVTTPTTTTLVTTTISVTTTTVRPTPCTTITPFTTVSSAMTTTTVAATAAISPAPDPRILPTPLYVC